MIVARYLAFFCILLFNSSRVLAFDITLSDQQINTMLQVGFPLKQTYQGFDISVNDPKVTLLAANNSVIVKTLIIAQQNGQKLRAIARAQGQVHYNKTQGVIEIIKPSLLEFSVLDNSLEQSSQAIDTIKQAVGQQLPMIFLLDVKEINQLFPGLQPRNIQINDAGLVITL